LSFICDKITGGSESPVNRAWLVVDHASSLIFSYKSKQDFPLKNSVFMKKVSLFKVQLLTKENDWFMVAQVTCLNQCITITRRENK